jgi:hypothetical protein
MLTVAWNPHGFHLVNVLSKEQKWTNQYYIDHILPERGALRDARDRWKFVVPLTMPSHMSQREWNNIWTRTAWGVHYIHLTLRTERRATFSLRTCKKNAPRNIISDCRRTSWGGDSNSEWLPLETLMAHFTNGWRSFKHVLMAIENI